MSLGRGAYWRCFPTSPSGTSFAGGVSTVAAVATHTSPEGSLCQAFTDVHSVLTIALQGVGITLPDP